MIRAEPSIRLIALVVVILSKFVENSLTTANVAAPTSAPAAICADSACTIEIAMSEVDVVADTVVAIPRPASRFVIDVVVVDDIVAYRSISDAIISSICDNDVPDAIIDCNPRRMLRDAADTVCALMDTSISRITSSSVIEEVVDAAMIADSSRNVAVTRSICDSVVCAAIVDDISRSTAPPHSGK